jgi:hypothetical protein
MRVIDWVAENQGEYIRQLLRKQYMKGSVSTEPMEFDAVQDMYIRMYRTAQLGFEIDKREEVKRRAWRSNRECTHPRRHLAANR